MGKTIRSPNIAADNWANRASSAANFYGTQVAGSAWKVYAASDTAEKNYATGVQAAVSAKSRQSGVNGSSDSAWQSGVSTVGVSRFSQGVGSAKGKMSSVMSKLIPAIDANRKALPPRGVAGSPDNITRMTQFSQNLHKQKGTFKARGVSRSA